VNASIEAVEFSEVVRRRRMVRHYSSGPLAPEVIERVLANALRAPSAGFAQGWAFLAITDPADRARFWPFVPDRVENTPTMQNAPLVVVTLSHKDTYLDHCAKPGAPWPDRSESHWAAPYWDIDTGMAALLMLLTAVDEELGACFFGIMPRTSTRSGPNLGYPATITPLGRSPSGTGPITCRRKAPALRRTVGTP
jgi:nitroreductase